MDLKTLLEKIESNKTIADLQSSHGFNLWHMVRYDILFHLQFLTQNLENPFASNPESFKTKLRFWFFLLFTAIKNPFFYLLRLGKTEYLFFSSDVVNIKTTSGKFTNRVHDYFATYLNQKSNVLIQETVGTRKITTPRNFPAVCYETAAHYLAALFSKFLKVSPEDQKAVGQLLQFITDHVHQDERFLREIEQKLLLRLKREYFFMRWYSLLFSMMKLKAVFLEDGCYNPKPGMLIAARKRNIKVIEPQHGLVYDNHLAYNFGASYFKYDSLKKALPDFFLGYGSFFLKNITLPFPSFSVGNPHLGSFSTASRGLAQDEQRRTLLFTTAGCSTESVNIFLETLSKWAVKNNYQIRFRPHPSERAAALRRYPVITDQGLVLDTNENIYLSIESADLAIGEYSTVLYECLYFKKPAIAFKNNYYATVANQADIIPTVDLNNIEELDALLTTYPMNIMYEIWEENWKENFETFLRQEIATV